MNIVFVWTGVTADMAACWRALAALPDVRLTVFTEVVRQPHTAYRDGEVLAGIDHRIRCVDEPFDAAAFDAEMHGLAPDVLVVLGWRSRASRRAAESPALAMIPKIFAFDMAFAWTLRKLLAPLVLRRYLRRFALAYVPGARSAAYARWLGVPADAIEQGLMGLDTTAYARAVRTRGLGNAYPRRFLFVGRYVPEKRLDLLVAAYRRYRAAVADPWGLTCCGIGPDARLLEGVEGVVNAGFVQPAELPAIHAAHGAFVLASDYDPWPFVIAEAAASALPIVCTAACGNVAELVRDGVNGRVCEVGSVQSLAAGLRWIHDRAASLPRIGAEGFSLVAPYDKDVWAERTLALARRAVALAHAAPR